MARKWNGFEENKDQYPNLEYRAVMDSKTRDEHRRLNGTILPINHPFWKSYYPPNGWGCRCSVVQTDKKRFKPDSIAGVKPDKGFDFNAGIEKKLFSDSAGYYEVSGKSKINDAAIALLIQDSRNINKIADNISARSLGKVNISTKNWKEAINQPHENYFEKNLALANLKDLLESATETKLIQSIKDNPMVKQYRALKVQIAGKVSWVLLREMDDGSLSFYTIVDKLKKEK